MTKHYLFIWVVLFCPMFGMAQFNIENRYIAIGAEMRPTYCPFSFHFKYIVNQYPSIIFKYARIDLTYAYEYITVNNNIGQANTMKYTQNQDGHSYKLGYVVKKDVDINYVTYTCVYVNYVQKNDVLNISHTDKVHGTTTQSYSFNNHSLGAEAEIYAGLRAIRGHLNIGASLYIGYLPPPIHPFKDIILNYPETNRYTYPDRGFGLYLLYFNAGLSAAICF